MVMKNVQDIVNIGRCIGCSACYRVCPKGYVLFKENGGMGFPVPQVENCDGCGNCLKVCPNSDIYDNEDE
jgi:NAD-dependent dihydropyrimidine dehydrogenase PreA subunit